MVSEPTGMRRARTSPPPQYRDDPLLRVRDDWPLWGSSRQQAIPNCSSVRASRPAAIVGPLFPVGYFQRSEEPRSVLRSRVKVFRLFGDLRFRIMQEKGADQTGEPSWVRAQLWRWTS